MSSQQPLDDPREDDPTGMRALLGSLGDPGPMPEDLVARITSSIAAERASMAHSAPGPVVTPLVRRRPLWQRAGLVAAGLLVVGAAGSSLTGTSPSDLASRLLPGAVSAGSASMAESDSADEAAGGSGAAPQQPSAADGLVLADTTASGTAYTTAALATQARSTMARFMAKGGEPGTQDDAGGALIATPAGLADCVRALDLDPVAVLGADLGTLDGVPAAVVVVRTAAGADAYAVRPDCRPGDSALIGGPVHLP